MGIMESLRKKYFAIKNTETGFAETKDSKPQLSQWTTFGNHLYRCKGEVAAVEFVNKAYGIRKWIVDNDGYIQNYPGVEKSEEWMYAWESRRALDHQIRFRTDFERMGDHTIRMVWEIQPDGRYWEDDDGFGAESGMEIQLYTYLDEKGNFTGPFRTYSIGAQKFYDR